MWIEIERNVEGATDTMDAIYIVMWIEILSKAKEKMHSLDAIYIVMWIEICAMQKMYSSIWMQST